MLPPESISDLFFPVTPGEAVSSRPSEIECAVLSLFEQYRDPILRYSLSFGVSVHDAEEVTQEVFLSLFQHLQLGRSRRNLRGWLFRVAHNLALKQRYASQKLLDRLEPGETTADRHADPSPDPEEHVAFLQRQRNLLAVVDAMPEADRSCLRLRAEGLRYREIAAVLGISLGSVSISLTRSIARLIRADGR
jgi:RNA polymerase sigma-70 factor (ECF subfamily)